MFNNIALDVFIGLTALYLIYSLFASILMEAVAKRLDLRARMTQKAIAQILDDVEFKDDNSFMRATKGFFWDGKWRFWNSFVNRPLTALFYAHPNIKNLGRSNLNRKPADISPDLFSDTFIQILRGDTFSGQQNQIDIINSNLKLINNPIPANEGIIDLPKWYEEATTQLYQTHIKHKSDKKTNSVSATTLTINSLTLYQLKQILFDSHSDIAVFKSKVIVWYNEMMDRATGWYIKQTRIILFIIGLALAIGFNVDTIAISKKLSTDKVARDKMIDFATKLKNNPPPNPTDTSKATSASNKAFDQAYKNLNEANEILGNTDRKDFHWPLTIFGWLITAFAISLGAPFWFDLLGKIMSIRQAGNSSNTKSVDDQSKATNIVSPKDRIG